MARRHANGDLRPAPRPGGPRIRVPPNRVEPGEGERRSPTGIARERETSVDHAAPYQRADRTTFESRSARPLAARLPGPCLSTGTAARRAVHPRTAEPRGEGERERRSPTGIARERETSADHAAPYQIPLLRHVRLLPPDPATATQIRLLRHVRLHPIPLQRHVPRQIPLLRHVATAPPDPATATCSPADPATATCSRSSRPR